MVDVAMLVVFVLFALYLWSYESPRWDPEEDLGVQEVTPYWEKEGHVPGAGPRGDLGTGPRGGME